MTPSKKSKEPELCRRRFHEWDRITWKRVRTYDRGTRVYVDGVIVEADCTVCPAVVRGGKIIDRPQEGDLNDAEVSVSDS